MGKPKRVASVQDLSCCGRCALAVALPVLSAAGVEACPLPMSLLSTHTGGFGRPAMADLAPMAGRILTHWEQLELHFDAIQTGYLANPRQLALAGRFIDRFGGADTLTVVDPAMADGGAYYAGLDSGFAAQMAALCARADILLPNLTEAAFLLGEQPEQTPNPERLARGLAERFGVRAVVLTGVLSPDGREIGAGVLENGTYSVALAPLVPASFHGAGDLFAAVLTACAVRGATLADSAQLAAAFTAGSIARTAAQRPVDERAGIQFEPLLGRLAEAATAICTRG